MVGMADELILLDDVQYTVRDWRNRNRIKTKSGIQWLTIPCDGTQSKLINEVRPTDPLWDKWHYDTLRQAYGKTKGWKKHEEELYWAYLNRPETLSLINRGLVELVCKWMGIPTKISWSTDYAHAGSKTERLVSLCRSAGATHYLSGPAAKSYLDHRAFGEIVVEWMEYNVGTWPQQGEFTPNVTVLDYIFNTH